MAYRADHFVDTILGNKLIFNTEARLEYANGQFIAGTVEGHPEDDIFLCIDKEWDQNLFLMLRRRSGGEHQHLVCCRLQEAPGRSRER